VTWQSAQQTEAAFYAAFARADVDGMMQVWSEDEAVFCVHPGGRRLSGVAAVRAGWRSIFAEGPMLSFDLIEVQRFALPTVAVHSLYEQIRVRGDTGPPHVVMATNIYVLTANGWRMLGHHASPLPRIAPASPPRPTNLH
jgi:ketosteroid isomerase-like protein